MESYVRFTYYKNTWILTSLRAHSHAREWRERETFFTACKTAWVHSDGRESDSFTCWVSCASQRVQQQLGSCNASESTSSASQTFRLSEIRMVYGVAHDKVCEAWGWNHAIASVAQGLLLLFSCREGTTMQPWNKCLRRECHICCFCFQWTRTRISRARWLFHLDLLWADFVGSMRREWDDGPWVSCQI